jgi:hypothetical protein
MKSQYEIVVRRPSFLILAQWLRKGLIWVAVMCYLSSTTENIARHVQAFLDNYSFEALFDDPRTSIAASIPRA